jgi:hypothetical protein
MNASNWFKFTAGIAALASIATVANPSVRPVFLLIVRNRSMTHLVRRLTASVFTAAVVSALSLGFLAASAPAGPLTAGNLVLVQVSGTVNSAGPITIRELSTTGSTVQSFPVDSGNGGGQISAAATSEGQLSLNASGDSWTLGVYVPPFTGSGSLSSRTATQAPRGFMTVTTSGSVSSAATVLTGAYSNDNIRSGVQSGDRAWFAGSAGTGSGIMTFSSGTAQVQDINSRVVQVINGDLFYSTGAGTVGLYKYTGLPTGAATSTAFLTGVTDQGGSPYDFALATSGSTLYVADDGIGVQKFTFNGSAWSHAYDFTATGVTSNRGYGLAVDFSTTNPTLYWTTPTNIYTAVDAGSAALGTSIASISSATGAFRGLDIVPVPEPTSLATLGCAAALYAVLRLRRRAA